MTSVLHRLRIALWRLAYSVRGEQGLGQEPFSPPWLMQPHLSQVQRDLLVGTGDPIRYGTLLLAFEQVAKDQIPGSLAECGVYQGRLSKFIHDIVPDRRLFLFDTFQGFDPRDPSARGDDRFRQTSEQRVLGYIGSTENISVRKGYFPETSVGLEDERFAFGTPRV